MPQAYEIPWAQLEFFSPSSGFFGLFGVSGFSGGACPPTTSVAEVAWPAGEAAPGQLAWGGLLGWRIVASDEAAGWVAWRLGFVSAGRSVLRREGEEGFGRRQDRG